MGALDGNGVIVTGGGRGIGREVALLAAAEGASVVVADNGCEPDGTGANPAVAQGVVDEITGAGGKAVAVTSDVSTMAGAEDAVKAALDSADQLDALITCAGIRRDTPIWEMTEDDWDSVINGQREVRLRAGQVRHRRHATAALRARRDDGLRRRSRRGRRLELRGGR